MNLQLLLFLIGISKQQWEYLQKAIPLHTRKLQEIYNKHMCLFLLDFQHYFVKFDIQTILDSMVLLQSSLPKQDNVLVPFEDICELKRKNRELLYEVSLLKTIRKKDYETMRQLKLENETLKRQLSHYV